MDKAADDVWDGNEQITIKCQSVTKLARGALLPL